MIEQKSRVLLEKLTGAKCTDDLVEKKCTDDLFLCFIQNYCSIITQIGCILDSPSFIKDELESRLKYLAQEKNFFEPNLDNCVMNTVIM
jgi:hypothetical protein